MAHMHYKGTGRVHSFRGLLGDADQRKIRIQGQLGDRAWRIIKFSILSYSPGDANSEHIVKIFREDQSNSLVASSAKIDFADDTLLAAAYNKDSASDSSGAYYTPSVIFDNALFVRNIYVTHTDNVGAVSCNYYIELEEVKLSRAGMGQLAVAAARRREGL